MCEHTLAELYIKLTGEKGRARSGWRQCMEGAKSHKMRVDCLCRRRDMEGEKDVEAKRK